MKGDILDGLNDAQRAAVEAVRGPLVILAGAGTGKTTTITRRIAAQVSTGEFAAGEILAVTFTTKAAREMGRRLERLGVGGVRANTFHAEALAQFRRFSPDQPEILAGKGQILHGIVQKLPPPHRFVPLRDIAGEIEWAKNRRIGARDYLERLGAHEPPLPPELMHRVYVAYETRKRRDGLIDFEDLLERTIATLEGDAHALGVVRGRYRAFTVDEYQDVNLLQQTLLDLWVGARDDVCVVGDDYQSIFGFTGASPEYLLRFARRYDHATVVTLTENYRSSPEILAIANRLVPRLGGSRKVLHPTRASGPTPTVRAFDTGREEVGWIVDQAQRLHARGTPYEEMAVLFRINGRSEEFEEAFAAAGVPYQVRDGSFLHRTAMRSFLARARGVASEAAGEVVPRIVDSLGYDGKGAYGGGDEATRQADLGRLLSLAGEFGEGTVTEFVADLRARFAPDEQGRGVHLMTYHRSKGLEFDAVFLPRMENGEMPFTRATSNEELAEERRLLYVGITRAREHLTLSYAALRDGERRSKPKPSFFLEDLTRSAVPKAPGATGGGAAASPKKAAPAKPATARGPIYDALREWRATESRARAVPAYVIFHDTTLAAIADAKPATPTELREIPGVGAIKMQRYGAAILEIVAAAPGTAAAAGA